MRHPFTCRLSRCAISVVLWVFCSITSQKQRAAQKMDGQPENARFPLQKASGWFLPAFTGHNYAGRAAATPPRPYFPSGSLVLHATQPRTEGGRQKTRRRPVPGKPTAAHSLRAPWEGGCGALRKLKKVEAANAGGHHRQPFGQLSQLPAVTTSRMLVASKIQAKAKFTRPATPCADASHLIAQAKTSLHPRK